MEAPSLETLRQQAEWLQIGLTLVLRQTAAVQAAEARGEVLDAATVAAEVERQLRPLWTEGAAICQGLNAHVAAHYGRNRR